jgi:MFS family permease
LVTLINRMGMMVLPFMMLHLTRNLGFEPVRAGLALSAYGLASLITAPLAGRLSDRLGAVRVLKLSLLSSGLVIWMLPLATSGLSVIAVLVLLAFTAEAFRPASLALVGDLAGPQLRKQGFALNRLAINLGMSVGPAVGGILAVSSFRTLFWVNGAPSMLAGAVLFAMPLKAIAPHLAERLGQATAPAGPSPSHRRLIYFMFALLPVLLVFFQHQGTLPLFMVQELGFSEAVYGLMFTFNTLLIVLLEVRLNGAMAHWSYRRSLALGSFLCGLGFGALALATSLSAVIATVIIWTVAEMILFPVSAAYVTEIAPPGRRGEYMGYYTMSFGLGFSIGPGTGSAVMQRFGSATLWAGTFVFGLISAALMMRIAPVEAVPAASLDSLNADLPTGGVT